MKVVNSKDFKEEIKEGVVLVDFFANWCQPCKALAVVLEELETEMANGVKIIKVDIDKSMDLAQANRVITLPTMIVFKDGEAVETMIGFTPKDKIKAQLAPHLV